MRIFTYSFFHLCRRLECGRPPRLITSTSSTRLFLLGLLVALSQIAQAQTITFNYTGGEQTYTIPASVTTVRVVAYGAQGAYTSGGGGGGLARIAALMAASSGLGGKVEADLQVTPGQVLTIVVGGAGNNQTGGYNGGGNGGSGQYGDGRGGGGGSDIRVFTNSLQYRVLVAGGGGGEGYGNAPYPAGGAGGAPGGNGADGSNAAGGAGAIESTSGYASGQGQNGASSNSLFFGGSGGGGGALGGYGGAASNGASGGGGGGSSIAAASLCSNIIHTQGVRSGNGLVEITLPCFPVSVTAEPVASSVICSGATVTAFVSASGSSPTYQWYLNNTVVSGATSATLNLSNVQTTQAGTYKAVVTNACGSATSTAFSLTVNGATGFTQQPPAGSAVCENTAQVSAMVSVSGTGPLTYLWYKDNAPLSGTTTTTLTLNNLQVSDAGIYKIAAMGSCGSVTSSAFSLSVDQPITTAALAGGTLTCAITSLTLISTAAGANSFTLLNTGSVSTTGRFVTSTDGSFTVRAGNTRSCTNTAEATTSVISNTAPPPATLMASSLTFCPGTSVTFTAGTGNNYNFTGPGLSQNSSVASATANQAGAFSVVVTGANSCTARASVTLTILSASDFVSVGALPTGSTICSGATFSLSASVTGNATGFQWYGNGQAVAGQTSATLNLAGVQVNQSGAYRVGVTAACNSVTSTAYSLTVNPAAEVVLTFPNGATVTGQGTALIQLPNSLRGQNMGVFGGNYAYWHVAFDKVNSYEFRQTEETTTGLLPLKVAGPYRLLVRTAQGCERVVTGEIRFVP